MSKDTKNYDDADCYTVQEFCDRHRISVSSYYTLRKAGNGPVEFRVGDKPLITKEEAARWRAVMVERARAAK